MASSEHRFPGLRPQPDETRAAPIVVLLVDDDEEDALLARELLSRIEGTRYELTWVTATRPR